MDAEQRAAARDDAGDLGAQVRRLQAELRQGRLTTPQLELAAWVGHPAAGAICAGTTPWAGDPPLYDRACALALAAAAGRVALAQGEALGDYARGAVRALENWLAGRIGLPELTEVGETTAHTEDSAYYLVNRTQGEGLRSQFRREVAAPNPHPVRDLLPLAHAWAQDDVVGIVLEGTGAPFALCEVHLTWTRNPPEAPGWPSHTIHTVRDWLAASWRGDLDVEPQPLDYLSGVIPLALCPATLERAPWFNGRAAMACLELGIGAEPARVDVGRLVQDWAVPSQRS